MVRSSLSEQTAATDHNSKLALACGCAPLEFALYGCRENQMANNKRNATNTFPCSLGSGVISLA